MWVEITEEEYFEIKGQYGNMLDVVVEYYKDRTITVYKDGIPYGNILKHTTQFTYDDACEGLPALVLYYKWEK